MLLQLTLAAVLNSSQDQLNHDGLPKLREIMQKLQRGKSSEIVGRRTNEVQPGQEEFEADFTIYKKDRSTLRVNYASYWGDSETMIITPKAIQATDSNGTPTNFAPAKSLANLKLPTASNYCGLLISLLSDPKDVKEFVDMAKDIRITKQDEVPTITFTASGIELEMRQLPDGSFQIRYPSPGFPGFSDPSTMIDTFRIRSTSPRFPDWYFQINN